MANYCDYKIYVRGSRKAVELFGKMLPVADFSGGGHISGTDEDCSTVYEGNCRDFMSRNMDVD